MYFGCLAVVVVGVIYAVIGRTSLAFTLGVTNGAQVIALHPKDQVCQRPIAVPETGTFNTIRFAVGKSEQGHQGVNSLVVSVLGLPTGELLARGDLHLSFLNSQTQDPIYKRVIVGNVPAARQISVCLRNTGEQMVPLYGNSELASRASATFLNGGKTNVNLNLAFEHQSRSFASSLPAIFARSALFRFPAAGAWLYWILLGLVIAVIPTLLAFALACAQCTPRDSSDTSQRPSWLASATRVQRSPGAKDPNNPAKSLNDTC